MYNQIKECQLRLFNKLFATLPSIKKTKGFNSNSGSDFKINHFFYFKNKDFWFANDEKEDKYYFLFGLKDKPLSNISENDVCLIIDFDKNIKVNGNCLGLFGLKNSEIHILINNELLKERYPNINTSDLNICNFKSFYNSVNLEIIDLGDLNLDFVDNIEKLIKAASIRPQLPRVIKTDSLGNKVIINQMNMILEDLVNGKTEDEAIRHANVSESTYKYWINRGNQDFGEVYVQFYQYINEIKSEKDYAYDDDKINNKSIEEKRTLVNEGIYEPLIGEYEDLFNSMNQTGIAWVNKTGNKWTYSRNINGNIIDLSSNTITELYEKVIDKDLIWGIRDYDLARKFIDIPDDFKIPKLENKKSFDEIDSDIYKPLPEEFEKSFTSMNQTGIAWVNQIGSKFYYMKSSGGKNIRLSGENIYDLHEKVKKAKQIWGIRDYDRARKFIDIPDDFEVPLKPQVEDYNDDNNVKVDKGIYAPLPAVYEKSFTSMNQSGIAWVNLIGKRWVYTKKNKGNTLKLADYDIYKLYEKVKGVNQIWGIRDYDRARKFIDIPDDFEVPLKPQIEDQNVELNYGIYAPLPIEYEKSFKVMNQSGIAWVSQIGKQWVYTKKVNGNTLKLVDHDIYKLYEKVKGVNQIWGIRDYSKASKYIDIPENFEIPKRQNNEISFDKEVNKSIYAPLSQYHLSKFNPNPNNKSGIAWVNKLGNNWFYQRQRNGKTVRITDSNIIKLHEKVIKNNQIWGIIDIDKARKAIETNSIDDKQYSKLQKTSPSIKTNSKVTVTFIEKSKNEFEILIKGLIKNKDLIDVLSRLDLFKENIKRIITNSINKEADIFIELIINKKSLSTFEEQIKDLGWKINK